MKTPRGLMPQYMKKFSCIGSACEDTCCAGWKIEIDKRTFARYETEPKLTPFIRRNSESASDNHYAEMILKEDSICPFLNNDKLCSIHLSKGEKYLPDLCATYPRVVNIVDNDYEISGTVSCPEIARLALLEPSGISFIETEGAADEKYIVRNNVRPGQPAERAGLQYFHELRMFSIQTLKNRTFSLTERMIILGLFYKELQEHIERKEARKIPDLASTYSDLMGSGEIGDRLTRFSASASVQIEQLRRIIDMRLFGGVKHRLYLQCLMEALSGIDYMNDTLRDHNTVSYTDAYRNYYVPFMVDNEYILENYLVNAVFGNLLPRLHRRYVFDGYAMIMIHYALIRFHLIGMAGYHKKAFGLDHVLLLIQSFSKTVEHTPIHVSHVIKQLKQNDQYNMEHLAMLIL